jgi:hypothetical protein
MSRQAAGTAVIIGASSGIGEALARELDHAGRRLDVDTLAVNVVAFMAVAQVAMRHFLARGRGHLVGITSVPALRGRGATAAYAASKAFQSVYLDGPSGSGAAQWTPDRRDRSPAGLCRYRHDEDGSPVAVGGSVAPGRFARNGCPPDSRGRSEAKEACVHPAAIRGGRVRPQAATSSRLTPHLVPLDVPLGPDFALR